MKDSVCFRDWSSKLQATTILPLTFARMSLSLLPSQTKFAILFQRWSITVNEYTELSQVSDLHDKHSIVDNSVISNL